MINGRHSKTINLSMVKNGLYTREKVWYFAFVAASIFFFIFTSNAFAATDFSIISPTTAVGTSTPSRAITLTVTGGPSAIRMHHLFYPMKERGVSFIHLPRLLFRPMPPWDLLRNLFTFQRARPTG
jgi:F0F1-type ATP synthase membrane subunit a